MVIKLRSQVRKPEDISLDDISPILDVFTEDSLEKFAKEQELAKNEAIKQYQENVKLKNELSLTEKALAEKETAHAKAQSELVHAHEKTLRDKKEIIEKLEKSKSTIDKLAVMDFNNFKIKFGVATAVLFAIPCFVTWKIGFDFMSILSFLMPLLLLVYLLVFEKEWNWKPSLFLKKKKEQYFQKKYLEFNFDINHLNKLKYETKMLEDEMDL